MNKKHFVVLSAIFAVLVLGVLVKSVNQPSELQTQENLPLEITFDDSTVDLIRIYRGADEAGGIELRRQVDFWQVSSFWDARADRGKIDALFAEMKNLKGEERGRSKSLFGDFRIQDDEAFHVVLSSGDQNLVHLVLGLQQAGWQNVFVRRPDSESVYLVHTALLSKVGIYGDLEAAELKQDFWADLKLFSFDPAQVEAVRIKESGGAWKELGADLPFSVGDVEFEKYLGELLQIKANGIVDPEEKDYGFDQPEWELEIALKGRDSVILAAGAVKDDSTEDRYVRASDSPQVFYVSGYTRGRIRVDPERFIKNNPLAIEEGKVEQLTVSVPEAVQEGDQKKKRKKEREADRRKQVIVYPKEDSWKGLEDYIKALKTLRVASLPDLKEGEGFSGAYSLEVRMEGKDPVQIVCEAPRENAGETLCVNGANNIPFKITATAFKSVFEDLTRLEKPAQTEPSAPEETEAPEGSAEKDIQ